MKLIDTSLITIKRVGEKVGKHVCVCYRSAILGRQSISGMCLNYVQCIGIVIHNV